MVSAEGSEVARDLAPLVAEQTRVLRFLADPKTHGGIEPEEIRTHASAVFLVGKRGFKLKRAVAYSFMDFSTVEKRRDACFAELRLNRRTAPALYLGVIPIREAEGSLCLGSLVQEPDGEDAVDWLVVMRRFDQASLFDRQLAAGTLDASKLEACARMIADFHHRAEIVPPRGETNASEALCAILEENLEGLVGQECFEPARVSRMASAYRAFLRDQSARLDQRSRDGWIRHCHGDLHLRNICELEGTPVLFDCIEFNPAFSRIDVMYDLAFLIMDLVARDAEAAAATVLQRYLEALPDSIGALSAMPLYLGMRAQIRAKVGALGAVMQRNPLQSEAMVAEARAYFDLAARLIAPAPPRLIAIGGPSGTGKSTLAAAIAPGLGRAPGAIVLRTDAIRKELWGVAPLDKLPPEAYVREVSQRVYAKMETRARDVLAAGYTVILDATFTHPESRRRVEAVASDVSVCFHGIWLEASEDILAGRIEARRNDVSDATPAVLRRQLQNGWGTLDWRRLDAGAGREKLLEAARAVLDT